LGGKSEKELNMPSESDPPPNAYQTAIIIQNVVQAITHAAGVSESNTTRLLGALEQHAAALVKSAEASDRAATRLVWATWALVGVTVLLVIVGAIQALILINR
jgi:hypothetical protein